MSSSYRFALQVDMFGFGSMIGGAAWARRIRPGGGVPGATSTSSGAPTPCGSTGGDQVVDPDSSRSSSPFGAPHHDRRAGVRPGPPGGPTRIGDANGNPCSSTPGGHHSSGKSVSFAGRQGPDRTDHRSMGRSIDYTYDSSGNLEAVTDRTDEHHTFVYRSGHYSRKGRPARNIPRADHLR